jgi:hypothetical protein
MQSWHAGEICLRLNETFLERSKRLVNMKRILIVLCAFTGLAAAAYSGPCSEVAGAQTGEDAVQMVANAKTSVDHQKLVKWYEQREVEVRNQARLYRKLADTYRDYESHELRRMCERIADSYDRIAKDYETLAEQHRHLAASQP